ncbi:MAG: XdhC family protein [Caldilinea sp.]|nr:XdhC family protein [Caldilineaceae bacterium]MCB9124373.1 XdhC family protein [Caldilineaceae bacterium]MCW5842723.1 XdhC family protein [Caldilinea sp.]
MRELLPVIDRWRAEQKRVALATVVKLYGSAPVPLGSKMAISSAGEMTGSVSGGCVESAVAQEALAILESDRPRLLLYGIADELAQSVGLACGGTIEVFVEPIDPPSAKSTEMAGTTAQGQFEEAVRLGRLVALATILTGPAIGAKIRIQAGGESSGTLDDAALTAAVQTRAASCLAALQSERVTLESAAGPVEVFIDVQPPQPRLFIVGAVHIAAALVTYANVLGFRTVVLDARTAFATPERFAHAAELIARWPADALAAQNLDEGSCVVVLTHDEKIDNPALAVALRSPARYVGALGSRKTHAKRVAALRELGLGDAEIARIHAPIGLPIAARRPEEIALSIMAEIVAVVNGEGGVRG